MKNLIRLGFLSAVIASSAAFAQEEGSSSGGGGMRRSGYLLDASAQTRPMRLAIHAVLPYAHFGYGGFPIGVGGVFYIPLVHNGFIPPLNDEFGIDFGADIVLFLGYSFPFALWIPVSALWTFHITDTFAAYAKLGVALRIWPGYFGGFGGAVWPDFTSAVGLNWMFSKSFGLRAEVGYPGIKVGILLTF